MKTTHTIFENLRAIIIFSMILIFAPILLHISVSAQSWKIAVETIRGSDREIYLMNADGSNQTNLTNHPSDDVDPFFAPFGTPVGNRIMFVSNRNDGNYEIYTIDGGSHVTRLTFTSENEGRPAYSPDGTKIAFGRASGSAATAEIWVMNSDGTNQVRLTNNSVEDNRPKWSPDGTKIIFDRGNGSNLDVFTMNPDGTNVTALTSSSGQDSEASYTPDGSKIVFNSARSGLLQVFTMNADGSNQVNVANHPSSNGSPSWSADGTKILFATGRHGLPVEIYSMNANGTAQTRLTNNNFFENTPVSGFYSVATSSNVSVGGQVLSNGGQTVSGARVFLSDNFGNTRLAVSNSFGIYVFDNVASGQDYIVSTVARGYQFDTFNVPVNENIADLNIIANP